MKNTLSWKKVFYYNQRAVSIWWKLYPQIFLSDAAYQITSIFISYTTIWFSANIIGELAEGREKNRLLSLVLILLISNFILGILNAVCRHWQEITKNSAYEKLDSFYNEKILSMDFASIEDPHTQDLFAQIKQNENWAEWGICKILPLFGTVIKTVIGIFAAVALSWQAFLLPVPEYADTLIWMNHPIFNLFMLLLLFGAVFLSPIIRNHAGEYWSKYAEHARFGNRAFGFFGYMGYERKRAFDIRIYQQNKICRDEMKKNDMFGVNAPIAKTAKGRMGILQGISDAVSRCFTGCIYLFVCLKAWAGAFGIGNVTQYISAITMLYDNIASILLLIGQMKNNAAFLQITFEFLDIPNQMYQGSLTVEKRNDCNYEIEFCNVSFRYPGAEEYALKEVNLKFRIGEKLAVVGENGSGKTTFIKLLCRLYDPTEGEILLNGINIKKYNYLEYLSIFSVVFQDFKLLSLPLGQNVAVNINYSKEKITDSLKKAGLEERICQMKEGLETYLSKEFSENGIEISGGEAQKIAIARALNKDAAFLILDEPTASLDALAEYEIYTKFHEIAGDRTAIYISHRLSSCRFCDEIIVFDRGKICQQGTHNDLLANPQGKYYTLWNTQAQYYKKNNQNPLLTI